MRKTYILKTISVLLLIAAGSFLFSACTTFAPESAPKRDKKSINILTYKNIPLSTLDGFHRQYPDYKINIERYPKLNYLSFLDTKLQQEHSIDIIELPAEAYPDYIQRDLLLPITAMPLFTRINSESLNYLKEISDSQYYYGVPYQSNYLGVWYNVSLFNKYGLQPPDNLENFLKACQVFSENDISPLAVGLADNDGAMDLMTLLTADSFASAAASVDLGNGFAGIEQPSYLDAFNTCYDMLNNGYLPKACLYMTGEQAFESFLNSSYAMALSPENSISMVNDPALQQIDINVCGFSTSGSGVSNSVIGVPVDSVMSISMQSNNIDACKLFLDYYTQYSTVFQYISDTRTMTTIQDYSINPTLSNSWSRIKQQPYFVPAEHFYLSPYLCDSETYSLPRQLFYNLITPQEFVDTLSSNVYD